VKTRLGRVALGLAAALALSAGLAQSAAAHPAGHQNRGPEPKHIFVIMMENHGFSQIIGNTADAPFINQLAAHANVATNYFGVTHPSLTNYLSAISGSFQGIWDDCKAGSDVFCAPEEFIPGSGDGTAGDYLTDAQIASASATAHLFSGANIVDQLDARGLSWRAYMQTMPEVGSQVEYWPVIDTPTGPVTVKLYAQKHNPFMYFSDINYPGSARLVNIVPFKFKRFAADLRSRHVPNLVWISPDQCNDMHGISASTASLIGNPNCGFPDSGLDHGAIQLGDAFLKKAVRAITHSRTWRTEASSLVIVWDEDDYSGIDGCCGSPTGKNGVVLGGASAPLLVINSNGRGESTAVAANHYSLLATIEHLWQLPCLANACAIGPSGQLGSLFGT
jgi:hypothetical protein